MRGCLRREKSKEKEEEVTPETLRRDIDAKVGKCCFKYLPSMLSSCRQEAEAGVLCVGRFGRDLTAA